MKYFVPGWVDTRVKSLGSQSFNKHKWRKKLMDLYIQSMLIALERESIIDVLNMKEAKLTVNSKPIVDYLLKLTNKKKNLKKNKKTPTKNKKKQTISNNKKQRRV